MTAADTTLPTPLFPLPWLEIGTGRLVTVDPVVIPRRPLTTEGKSVVNVVDPVTTSSPAWNVEVERFAAVTVEFDARLNEAEAAADLAAASLRLLPIISVPYKAYQRDSGWFQDTSSLTNVNTGVNKSRLLVT